MHTPYLVAGIRAESAVGAAAVLDEFILGVVAALPLLR